MSSNRVLIIAFAASLLIHALIIVLVNFDKKDDKNEKAEKEPVEISIVPKEKPEQVKPEPVPVPEKPRPTPPPPPPPEPPIVEENEKTTLEHDKVGGPKQGTQVNEDLRRNMRKDPPKQKPVEPIKVPKVVNEDKAPEQTPVPEVDTSGLKDTKDVTDRIANQKKDQPKGEDTASYNVFEERYASYFGKFRRLVYQVWTYPRTSIANGETGVVTVSFSILKDGTVVNIKMKQSSGYPALDREVMRVLKNVRKIPLPESYELEQLNVDDAYFIYSMGGAMERLIR